LQALAAATGEDKCESLMSGAVALCRERGHVFTRSAHSV
jgi:hypothetical protein